MVIFADRVREAHRVRCLEPDDFRLVTATDGEQVVWSEFSGVREFSPDDMVVVAGAGTPINLLNHHLEAAGQCIPIEDTCSLAHAYLMNLPHPCQGRFGSWREWVLGMQGVLADGTVFRSGSKAVKNVAGYDIHRFLIGSRGVLAIPTEFILRTSPIAISKGERGHRGSAVVPNRVIQRVLPQDFEAALASFGDRVLDWDPESSTVWATTDESLEVRRFPHDWVLRARPAQPAFDPMPPPHRDFLLRAKAVFDPEHKLNPGEFGFL